MGRNWTRRSIEELIDEYLDKHGRISYKGGSGGGTPPIPSGNHASFMPFVKTDYLFFHGIFLGPEYDGYPDDEYGMSTYHNEVPLKYNDGTKDYDIDFATAYGPGVWLTYIDRDKSLALYMTNKKWYQMINVGTFFGQPFTAYFPNWIYPNAGTAEWEPKYLYYYDTTTKNLYRLCVNNNDYDIIYSLIPYPHMMPSMFSQARYDLAPAETPDGQISNHYFVEYTGLNNFYNTLWVYNLNHYSQVFSSLNNGYLIGSNERLTDDFLKHYVEWFLAVNDMPASVQILNL